MNPHSPTLDAPADARPLTSVDPSQEQPADRPLVSLILPVYNEASVIQANLDTLYQYLDSHKDAYRWEIILVNDGSTDDTEALAEQFARTHKNVHVLHHVTNFGLGQALKTGIDFSRGDFVVTLDMDLSYAPTHICELLAKMHRTGARIVVASPYASGGSVSNVPFARRTLSVWANHFLSALSQRSLSTLTGMVRAYDGRFIRGLSLRSPGMEVNPEVIYKAMVLRARIEELPAHLQWHAATPETSKRKSSMRARHHIFEILLSGFFFKPFMCFILPGFALLLFSVYVNAWMLIHFFRQYKVLTQYSWFLDRASFAVGVAYQQFPHTFIVGLISMMLAIQLISLGILAKQNKHYFEEIFYLGTSILRRNTDEKGERT